ncbi:MAG: hypothetical protein J3K34DRAFT_419585 [Monoraphidium minutum]|nr:MAG: hypothetical protein J3K34DRAFT_419585 [Monoraphidium minutum]
MQGPGYAWLLALLLLGESVAKDPRIEIRPATPPVTSAGAEGPGAGSTPDVAALPRVRDCPAVPRAQPAQPGPPRPGGRAQQTAAAWRRTLVRGGGRAAAAAAGVGRAVLRGGG